MFAFVGNRQKNDKRGGSLGKTSLRTQGKLKYFSWSGALLVIILFTSVSVSAQFNRRKHVHYGVTANFHQTKINDFHLYSKGRMGADFGFFAQIPIQGQSGLYTYSNTSFYVVPQIEFSMMGENSKRGTSATTHNYHYGFVNIPIYAKYYLNGLKPRGDDRFFIMLGPMFGFAVNEKVDMTNDHVQQLAQESSFQNFNFAISVKAGYSPFRGFEAFLRLDRGITKVYNAYDSNNYHGKLAIGLSWIFR